MFGAVRRVRAPHPPGGAPPPGPCWLHEPKFDSYRLRAQVRRRGAKLLTRSGLD